MTSKPAPSLPTARVIDAEHWARPLVESLIATIDSYDDATFEALAVVHEPAVAAVMAAYRPGSCPAITSHIIGAEAWHGVFDLAVAVALGELIPD